MKALTVDEIRKIEDETIRSGVPEEVLMERAGKRVAEESIEFLSPQSNIVILCGKGKNGGDGLVAARHLTNKDYSNINVFIIGAPDELKGIVQNNYIKLKNLSNRIYFIDSLTEDLKNNIKKSDLIIDALFGIGLKSEVKNPFREIVDFVNSCNKVIVAVDVPSGIDANSGNVMGSAIKARKTITFGYSKKGLVESEGPKYAGKIMIADIGLKK